MQPSLLLKVCGALCAVTIVGVGVLVYINWPSAKLDAPADVPVVRQPRQAERVIGTSVEGRKIEAFSYGTGPTRLVFVGGVHGGYEWNSVLLAYAFIDHLKENPDSVPSNIIVTVIPNANPDGVYKIIGKEGRFTQADVPEGDASSGRFNANQVDLNRNFGCKWKPQGTWRGNTVSAGSEAFSEPEASVLRTFFLDNKPEAVVFWHSQSNAVYASECLDGILPKTLDIMNVYASAAKYPAVEKFDAYEVNGDAEAWLASIGVPAITVELSTHETVEWERNLKGITALLNHFGR
jgi:predicted deacylase